MKQYEFFLTSSLEKVFPDQRPKPLSDMPITILAGELPAVQLVVFEPAAEAEAADIRLSFDLSITGAPVEPRWCRVELIPSDFPAYASSHDEHYLRTTPGLFPDLLRPMKPQGYLPVEGQYRAVWIDFPNTRPEDAGTYTITVTACALKERRLGNGTYRKNRDWEKQVYSCSFTLQILPVLRPKMNLIHSEWLYADCIASCYKLPIFSENHWRAIENFIRFAAEETEVNALLTPVFTPPLDTAISGQRPTVQLVDIEKVGDRYHFSFGKLERWCSLCKKYGIQYVEVAHFFTQWGAYATPKIMATVNGEEQQIFGWDVAADDPGYRNFLIQFIPALQNALAQFGYENNHVVYHISDEPQEGHQESYQKAKAVVQDLLEGCRVIDALSDYRYYETGLVAHPVPSLDHIQPFLEHKVPDLWAYYCCGQTRDVPNRFFAMPSYRNRILGVLLYLYDIKGFLHWGFNFYYSQFSLREMNPFCETHADYAFPSGDAYLVYPGDRFQPLSSIRSQVLRNAWDDYAALQYLQQQIGRDAVERGIIEIAGKMPTFTDYPHDEAFLFALREWIGSEL